MKDLQIRACKEGTSTKKEYLVLMLTYALLMSGYLKIIFSGFPTISSYWWIYAAVCVLIGAVFMLIPDGKVREYLLPAGLLFILVLFFAGFSYSRNGLCVLGNEYLSFLTGKTGKIYLDFPTNGNRGTFYVSALGCAIITLCVDEMLYKRKRLFAFVLAFLCMTGCVIGFFEIDYGVLILMGAIICLIFSGNISVSKAKGLVSVFATFFAMIVICSIFAFIALAVTGEQFSTKYIARTAKQTLHQAQYDTGLNAMPEGNLRNLNYFKKSNETALKLTTKNPQKFYLKGMVGEVYTGNAWEELPAVAKQEGEDLFYWLHKNDFFGQTSIASAVSLADNAEQYQLKITNISACREHQYFPYGLADMKYLDSDKIADTEADYMEAEMDYNYFSGSLPQWYEAYMYLSDHYNEKKVQEYLTLEQSYREFVYENDLQLTNTAIGVFERIFGTEKKERSLAEILELVRETLEHNLEYKENITTPNGKNDFLKYTMEQSKQGYSVHYATTATLMLRYFGVPARYVEGYYLSSEEASKYAPMEEITVTEAHAHAWTEIYLDGIGWIPFEVTPGYIDEEELAAAEQMVSEGLGEGTGKSYRGTGMTYKPPKQQEEEQHVTDWNSLFRFEVKDVISLLLIILIILLLVAFYRIFKRRQKLLGFFKDMEKAEHRDAITGLFAYSTMLMETCGVTSDGLEDMQAVNCEALFSSHSMNSEQREQIEEFTKTIIAECKQKLRPLQKLRYHYILWLYR